MDCYLIADLHNDKVTLFMPKLDNLYKIWMNFITKDQTADKYKIEVKYMSELEEEMKKFTGKLYINEGTNTDSNLKTDLPDAKYLENHTVDRATMHDILAESRVIKNDEEIVAMRWASQITAEAHVNVMRNVKANMREMQLESFFNFYGQQHYFTGRVAPYLSICGCGPSAATLHYHDNKGLLKDGTTMLTDQGHSLHHYVSDVTTSWPVNGKFTKKQAEIYNLVLKSSRAVFEQLKPGTDWIEMHLLAERVILSGLVELGCLSGDVEEMMKKRIGFLFMPHGLGHLIGLDTHDVGGYLPTTPERRQEPGLKNVRMARIIEVGVVLTIEPGCYFRDFLLDGEIPKDFYEFDLSFLNRDKIREYQQEIQGVRIEDVVLITETGNENLSYDIPRTVEQIEKCMAGQEWRQ